MHIKSRRNIPNEPTTSSKSSNEEYHHDEGKSNWFDNLDGDQNKQAIVVLSIFLFISLIFVFVLYKRYRLLLKKYLALKAKRPILNVPEDNSDENTQNGENDENKINLAQFTKRNSQTGNSSRVSSLKIQITNGNSTEQTTCDPNGVTPPSDNTDGQTPIKTHLEYCHNSSTEKASKESLNPFKPSNKTFRTPAPSHKSSNASNKDLNSQSTKLNFDGNIGDDNFPRSMNSPIAEENSFNLSLNTSGPVMSAYEQLENRPVLKQST